MRALAVRATLLLVFINDYGMWVKFFKSGKSEFEISAHLKHLSGKEFLAACDWP